MFSADSTASVIIAYRLHIFLLSLITTSLTAFHVPAVPLWIPDVTGSSQEQVVGAKTDGQYSLNTVIPLQPAWNLPAKKLEAIQNE